MALMMAGSPLLRNDVVFLLLTAAAMLGAHSSSGTASTTSCGAGAGGVAMSLGGSTLLVSNETAVVVGATRLSTSTGTLACLRTTAASGTDALGAYERTAWSWAAASDGALVMETAVREYGGGAGAVRVYEQSFPGEVAVATSGQWLSTEFPSYRIHERPEASTTTGIAFNGPFSEVQAFWPGKGLSECKMGVQGGVVLLVEDATKAAVAFSQLTSIKTGEMDCTGRLAMGIQGNVTRIPAGYTASWISVQGDGVKGTMEAWGDALLRYHGKTRADRYGDAVRSTLGFWTPNGAWFHYAGFEQPGQYQAELVKAVDAFRKQRIPIGHWQGDSWWYYKLNGSPGSSQNTSNGMYRWQADTLLFPKGMPGWHDLIGVPFVLHNRWLCNTNWYMAHGIGAPWTNRTQKNVLPYNLEAFYVYFFTQQPGFGLATYEQDFLHAQYDGITDMATNATFADEWLRAMATNAAKANLTIQYCMAHSRDFIASVQFPNVATIRASNDYHSNTLNWQIQRTSLFAHALGLLPFKDTFLSSSGTEPGGSPRALGPELSSDLQALVSTLSASIVAPGDGPGLLNKTRLMQTCRADGIVLKPDRPSLALDVAWTAQNPGGELGSTVATSGDGGLTTTYVLAAELEQDYCVAPAELGLHPAGQYVAYNWYTGELAAFSTAAPLNVSGARNRTSVWEAEAPSRPKPTPVAYSYVFFVVGTPLPLSNLVVIGEPGKFVTASSKRVATVTDSTSGVVVGLVGAAEEVVTFCVCDAVALDLTCKTVVLGALRTATVAFSSRPS